MAGGYYFVRTQNTWTVAIRAVRTFRAGLSVAPDGIGSDQGSAVVLVSSYAKKAPLIAGGG